MPRRDWRARASKLYKGLVSGGITETENALNAIYRDAWKGLSATIQKYFDAYAARDSAMYKEFEAGKITEAYYKQWRVNNIGRGRRFEDLRDNTAQRLLSANQQAAAYVNNDSAAMYALGHDYTAYTIEAALPAARAGDIGARINFNLTPERAIREAVNGGNHVNFRVLSVNPVRDYQWNAERITQIVASGLQQGKSVQDIAKDFLTVMQNNEYAAIRNARTALTSAAGAGCQAAAEEAEDMGLKVLKEWVATDNGDDRTRKSHMELNGVRVPVDEPFPNGLMYPGDPAGEPAEVYNCRCTMITVVEGLNDAARTNNNVQSYQKWRASKNERVSDQQRGQRTKGA